MFIKKIFLATSITLPSAFLAISCGSSTTSSSKIEETKELENNLSSVEGKTLITSKNLNNVIIKNFVDLSEWKNIDDFFSENFLGKYFTLSEQFKLLLQKDGNRIFNAIKRVSIQPTAGSTSLTIIFYLSSSLNDSNVVSYVVENSLTEAFNYQNLITIQKNNQASFYENSDAFNNDWKKIENYSNADLTTFQSILNKAFIITSDNLNTLYNAYKSNKISIKKTSSNQINVELKKEAINEGFIFTFDSTNINSKKYDVFIISNSLVK